MILNGKARYAAILGDPRDNKYNEDNRQWTIGVVIDKETVKKLKTEGLGWKIKTDDKTDETFINFSHNEFDKEGDRNDPIPVVDRLGKPWNPKTLIGNGSEVNVRIRTWGKPKTFASIEGVQVVNLVKYERVPEPFPVYESNGSETSDSGANNETLNDDLDDLLGDDDDDEVV